MDIAAKNKLHPGKLGIAAITVKLPFRYIYVRTLPCAARALRLLATHHVFIEVRPDVFTNNSLSSILDTGKQADVLLTQSVAVRCGGRVGVDMNATVDQGWTNSRASN